MQTTHEQRDETIKTLRACLAGDSAEFSLDRSAVKVLFDIVQDANEAIGMKELDLVNSGMVKIDKAALLDEITPMLVEKGWQTPEEAAKAEARTFDVATSRENLRMVAQKARDWLQSWIVEAMNIADNEGDAKVVVALLDAHLSPTYPRIDNGVTIRHLVYDADDRSVGFAASGSTSTSDAVHEVGVMHAALELERAVRLRGVKITPEQLWEHTIGRRAA